VVTVPLGVVVGATVVVTVPLGVVVTVGTVVGAMVVGRALGALVGVATVHVSVHSLVVCDVLVLAVVVERRVVLLTDSV
jgi:hypothetical protein